jgi:hypothetical protein
VDATLAIEPNRPIRAKRSFAIIEQGEDSIHAPLIVFTFKTSPSPDHRTKDRHPFRPLYLLTHADCKIALIRDNSVQTQSD